MKCLSDQYCRQRNQPIIRNINYVQWRIRDFPIGAPTSPTPEVGAFCKIVCQNERIGTLGGGARQLHPLDPPMMCAFVIHAYRLPSDILHFTHVT